MKAALTVWENRISPVFDVSREALIVEIKDHLVVSREQFKISGRTALDKISWLKHKDVEALICGAISESLYRELRFHQMSVNGFVVGAVEEVIHAFVHGTLGDERFLMPGCRRLQSGGRRRNRIRMGG